MVQRKEDMVEKCEISIESLVMKLGVPEDGVQKHLDYLYQAFGREGDPIQRVTDYLKLKIELKEKGI